MAARRPMSRQPQRNRSRALVADPAEQREVIENVDTGERARVPADALFVFIGATPSTEWLGDAIARDEDGFVIAGIDLLRDGAANGARWSLAREPYRLETSLPGVFVAGDVRKGSVKRIASAVGEGAMAVQYIHRYRKNG